MWFSWLPWRWLLSRFAKAHGFVDPLSLLARLHQFSQPSEVTEPIELVRAGLVFHARGLINTRAIQHNLDWVWPFWVERQYDPLSESFVPRAFSITHVNLTHRNWTAVGLPDLDALPVVDPRGLLMPLFDSWSLDAWIVPDRGEPLYPSRAPSAGQELLLDRVAVRTRCRADGLELQTVSDAIADVNGAFARLNVQGTADVPAWLVVSLRPANPEGVSLVHDIQADSTRTLWTVNQEHYVQFDTAPDRTRMSTYAAGDVASLLFAARDSASVNCGVGLATAAAMFQLTPRQTRSVTVTVPLSGRHTKAADPAARMDAPALATWPRTLQGLCTIDVPDARMRFLFDAAVRTLVLHTPGEVYPGPYTYKRFWFRDAAFILEAALALGMIDRVERAVSQFPARQRFTGYFHSQDGEWDSNGQVLWLIDRLMRVGDRRLSPALLEAVAHGANWMARKRLSSELKLRHAGLMPAGFSAEHLGPNDFYYWDDFWSAAGLRAAARLLDAGGRHDAARNAEDEAQRLLDAVDRIVGPSEMAAPVPASPYRRMDAGAIGSIVAGYPLRLWGPRDPRLLATVEFILRHCTVRGGFFQDVIHSGINAYLTLHLAQVLLRAGDPRHFDLIETVADLATPTGQWPEAIHPRTLGGCMGDGQHAWASAEWVLMMRNLFVREEDGGLVLGSGLPQRWLVRDATMRIGPVHTAYGPVSVEVACTGRQVLVRWEADWHNAAPHIEVRIPGLEPIVPSTGQQSVALEVPARSHAAEFGS